MSSSTIITEIEKIRFNDPELLLNSEQSRDSSDKFMSKCGEVFLQHRQQHELFMFICTLCEDKFNMLETFTQHIQDAHLIVENDDLEGAEMAEEQPPVDEQQCVRIEEDLKEEEQHSEDCSENLQLEPEFLHSDDNDNEVDACTLTKAIQMADPLVESFDCSDEEQHEEESSFKDCGKDFKRASELSPHINSSGEDDHMIKLFQCSKCAKCFKRKSNMKTHELTHQAIKPYACDQCSATFANKQNLVIHKRRHSGEKPFQCSYCEKKFVSSTELKIHERSHTGKRPFVCEHCGKDHTTFSQLMEHRKQHTNERRYHCDDCGKNFRTSTHLRSHHTSIHANLPRSLRCSLCGACFKTQSAMQQHLKIHAEVKQYKCRLCEKEFAQHPGLYAHMKTHTR